ncbi:HlyD family efflux transporter periplasmic adaptor subunit [Alishewanella sp. d11]|uniref:HlyD family efflux transporter periplasmic adaptor subunit n=1 Tax=Alishewanella sp. d11 TaxID=3414030 RepID=UPI003BF7FF2D
MHYIKMLLLSLGIALLGGSFAFWWHVKSVYPATDDAYVKANLVGIAAQIQGRVAQVLVQDGSRVQAGEVLIQLEQASLKAAVAMAEAQLDLALQNAGAALTEIEAASAALSVAQSQLAEAELQLHRVRAVFDTAAIAQSDVDHAKALRDQAAAAVSQAESKLHLARLQAGPAGNTNPAIRYAKAALTQARLALEYSVIKAPTAGWIANMSLQPGTVVAAGQALFTLVDDAQWWVEANFRETDLQRIKIGQSVSVVLDMYPKLTVEGKVSHLGIGSGAVFSLLPPQNATGNWVKVTQRFPVKISLTAPSEPQYQLRLGASAAVKVDTVTAPQAQP